MSIWYRLTPTDTLFFRGAEPMEAGQLSGTALFPPPVSVIAGALRSEALRQKNISFADYNRCVCPPEVVALLGKSGEPAPFAVTAILLEKAGAFYLPCPAHWFTEKDKAANGANKKILRGKPPEENAAISLNLHSSAGLALPMVLTETEPVPLNGHWLRLRQDCLNADEIAADDLPPSSHFYDTEPRTGIALDDKRRVKDGKLYSAAHIRLCPDVALVIAIDLDLGLRSDGMLPLGGERRLCGYKQIADPVPPTSPNQAALYLALTPVELTAEILPHVFATGKPAMLAGWDLHTGFHKPSASWLPAGAVFTKNINKFCLPLPR